MYDAVVAVGQGPRLDLSPDECPGPGFNLAPVTLQAGQDGQHQ